jgi:hypothetical protein
MKLNMIVSNYQLQGLRGGRLKMYMDNIVNDVNLLPTLEELEELAEILLSDIKEYEREQEREAIQVDKENREQDLLDYYCLSLQK